MKRRFTRILVGAAVWLGASAWLLGFHAHNHQSRLPNFDARTAGRGQVAVLPADKAAAVVRLTERVPGLKWEADRVLAAPNFVAAPHGFLSGPGGVGKAISAQALQAVPADDPHRAVKAFLSDHPGLFGFGPEALNGARVKREFTTAHSGLKTVVWEQHVDGIALYGSVFIGHVTRNGELVNLSSRFVPVPAQAAEAGTPNRAAAVAAPPISAEQAIVKAAENIGETVALEAIAPLDQPAGAEKLQKFQAAPVLNGETIVHLVWLPMDGQTLKLCWQVMLTSRARGEMFLVLVDARSGAVLLRRCLTENITNATYRVYTSDSPSPFSPGHPTPMTGQPPLVQRSLLTLEAVNTNASPNGWINDADNETTGNNVDAHTDRDNDNQPDLPRPVGNPTRVFDFPLDLTQAPTTYSEAAVVQLFYWNNWMHDKLWELGFTEAAGNFQVDNFGRGGLGNDPVQADAQDGGGFNNANMATPPDGFSPRMQMYLLSGPSPDRDGDLDADVVLHEYTHGLSNRRVGGGVGLFELQSRGMGEGWSDFYALSLLSEPSDDVDAVYPPAGYFAFLFAPGFQENYYYGDRHYPYTTDTNKNPFTFKDIDPTQADAHAGVPLSPLYRPFNPTFADEVHNQGEVWCVTLWDVRANLIRKYGFAVGNQLTLQLVTDGMNLSPPDPNFLQARDAILQADLVNNGNANFDEIWRAFAKRGMGGSASSPSSSTTVGVVEAFDLPGLALDAAAATDLATGNGNGAIDPNECVELNVVLVNKGRVIATGVNTTLRVVTPGVLISQADSGYADILPSGRGTNLVAFKFYTSPTFICGTPIELLLDVNSSQDTRTIKIRLETGQIGTPIRFNNDTPVPIPDADPIGVDSPILVSGFSSAISKVTVSLHLTHTFVFDLDIRLIGPDGTSVALARNPPSSGDNFGLSCAPDTARTIFDDKATVPINAGVPPYLGSFKPQEPLAKFNGKSGAAVNGLWRLHVSDIFFIDLGTIQCWSLHVSPTLCSDGGGDCSTDLALSGSFAPAVPVVGSNLTYTLTVTNRGPNAARNVVLTDPLPPGTTFVSASSPNGNCSQAGGTVTCSFGSLAALAQATANIVIRPNAFGALTNAVTLTSTTPDPNSTNNAVTLVAEVRPPSALVVAAGAILVSESLSPPTGGIDPGERVTLNLALRNIGSLNTLNVVATLLETGGVTLPTGPQSYGALLAGGPAATNQFSFTASSTSSGNIAVTLRLQDGSNALENVVFTFGLGATVSITNASRITLPDVGAATNLYPSSIFLSGVGGLINKVTVSLNNIDHSFPDDLDVLLVGPRGDTVLLMSDAGGGTALNNLTLTFDDAGAALPDSAFLTPGSYRPTDYEPGDPFPPPAPAGPYGNSLAIFNGREANGLWSLYVVDDTMGDAGRIAGGWTLTVSTVDLVNPTADLQVLASGTPATATIGSNVTYTVTVTNLGPDTATGVLLTNLLPVGAQFVSAATSQGSFSNDTGRLFFAMGSLTNQGQATAIIVATLTRSGTATNIAHAVAAETDPGPANSRATVLTTVSPAADLAVQLDAAPLPAVVGEMLVFTVTVTNQGPDSANSVWLTNSLPASVTNVSAATSQGSCSVAAGRVTCSLGTLAAGARATVWITNRPASLATLTNTAQVRSLLTADLAPANNAATLATTVFDPFVRIVPAASILLSESFSPSTGGIESGETVTMELRLRNNGESNTTDLVAVLLNVGGVQPTSLTATQNYGLVLAGGAAPVGRLFTFTATGAPGNTITPTLQLRDGEKDLGTVSFSFGLGAVVTVANPGNNAIADNGRAGVYPATIAVTNVAGTIAKVTMTLSNLSHAYPDDIDVLLVGPEGQSALMMSDAGGGNGVQNVTLAFDDAAAGPLPDSAVLVSSGYRPTDYAPADLFPAPAPMGPYGVALSVFNGRVPNGTWSLFVVDDTFGDLGFINNGWSLTISTVGFLNLPPAPPRLGSPAILGDGSFRFVVEGEPGAIYVIEVSSDLNSWDSLGSITFEGNSGVFLDPNASSQARRFYRARRGP